MAIVREFIAWTLTLGPWVVAAIVFLGRNWILERIKRSVGHGFDEKLEELRTDLRKSEEEFKSELREKESEISVLRNAVLSGNASRQSLLDKRRFEAVEKIWSSVNEMGQLKMLSGMMAILKFDAVAKEASDPRMQQFLSVIGAGTPELAKFKNVARDEQPFVPELAWAYFSAYRTILISSYVRYSVLKIGLVDADKFFKDEGIRKVLKAALPNFSEWIDTNDPGAYHYLLDHIETNLLIELRKILEGKGTDKEAIERAKEIMEAVKGVESEKTKAAAAEIAN